MSAKHNKASFFINQGLFKDLYSFTELENRIAALPEENHGDAFEVFAEAYLQTKFLTPAQDVWPDNAIPPLIRDELQLISPEIGVDGLILTHDEKYHAY